MWNETDKLFYAEERGFHTLSVDEFLPQNHGINTQSREITRDILQEQNLAPTQILSKLRDQGIAEKDLPTRTQINSMKMSMKNDHSETSKFRLRNFLELKEFFAKYIVTSKEQYEALGTAACFLL